MNDYRSVLSLDLYTTALMLLCYKWNHFSLISMKYDVDIIYQLTKHTVYCIVTELSVYLYSRDCLTNYCHVEIYNVSLIILLEILQLYTLNTDMHLTQSLSLFL